MAGEWHETQLAEVASITSGKRPTVASKVATPTCQVPVIGGGGPSGFTETALYDGRTLITGRVGTLGKLFASSGPCWPSDNALVIQPLGSNTDAAFLRYALQLVISQAAGMNRGAANPLITQGDLGRLVIGHPPLADQRAIAHILGTLDDKIVLNRRMNETLEAMARALFKSWFVDFDPVRAKVEGRDPGLPQSLADIFPDSFEDSELGEIPKGWIVSRVGEHMINFDSKRVPVSGSDRAKRQGSYPYHGAAGVMDHVDDFLFDGIHLLVGEDGSVMQDSGIAVTQYVWGRFWVNNHAHVLQGKGPISTEQLCLYFHFEPVAPYVTGAVQPKLSQGRMNTLPFVFGGTDVCRAFGVAVLPWFAQLRANGDASKTLTVLRDMLLPKLVSGELRAS